MLMLKKQRRLRKEEKAIFYSHLYKKVDITNIPLFIFYQTELSPDVGFEVGPQNRAQLMPFQFFSCSNIHFLGIA